MRYRYDILEQAGRWILTDGRGPPHFYLSSAAALGAAKAEARDKHRSCAIYMWDNGKEELVFKSEDFDRSSGLEPGS